MLRPRSDFYAEACPTPTDVFLLIEVSDSTQTFDRTVKGTLCARSGISEYGLLDLMRGVLEVYRSPAPNGYADLQRLRTEDRIAPLAFPGCELDAGFLLGLS